MEVSFAHPFLENQELTQASLWEDDKYWRGVKALACGSPKEPPSNQGLQDSLSRHSFVSDSPGDFQGYLLLAEAEHAWSLQNDILPSCLSFLFEFF